MDYYKYVAPNGALNFPLGGGVRPSYFGKQMKTSGAKSAFTLIELLVVIIVVASVAMLVAFKPKDYELICLSNQRQIALGLQMFQNEYNGKYPWQVSSTNSGSSTFSSNAAYGSMESITGKQAFPHFRTLSPYVGKSARIFFCPTDKARQMATNSAQLLDENISYFLNLDATNNRTSILTGDRHLEANNVAVHPGLFGYSTNKIMNWTRELHTKSNRSGLAEFFFPTPIEPQGVLSFADGHAEVVQTYRLNTVFKKQPVATNLLVVP